jgi:hypothetical protein
MMRLRFWLRLMDIFLWLDWDRAWIWALRHASARTDWGEGRPGKEW